MKLSAGAAASVMLPALLNAAPKWKKIPIATQAWCVRRQMAGDIPGTLAAVAALGYQGIELENAFGKSGTEWRGWLAAMPTTWFRPCAWPRPRRWPSPRR